MTAIKNGELENALLNEASDVDYKKLDKAIHKAPAGAVRQARTINKAKRKARSYH